jgi:hypothetical protein
MAGYVMISRDIWTDPSFVESAVSEREAWIWLISEASWKPRERRIGTLLIQTDRGQLAVAIRFMAEAWQWSKSKVERYLKRLKDRDMIMVESGTGISLITICSYDKIQSPWDKGETAAGQPRDIGGTNDNKEEKNRKEGEKEPSTLLPQSDDIAEAIVLYNATADHTKWSKVQKLTASRRVAMRARLTDVGGISGFKEALHKASASDFLCGRIGSKPFYADFDFLIRESSFTKLMEGKYDNRTHPRTPKGRPHGPDPAIEQIARLTGHQ